MPIETFDALFEQVPAPQKASLQRFWLDHPYQERVIGNARWRYLVAGQGRRLILLLPHPLAPADMWFSLISALKEGYRCIIPDGYALQGVYDADLICEALVHLVESEGGYSATCIAHSSGGSPAQFMIQRYPHRVQHLILSHCIALEQNAPLPLQSWQPVLGWAPWPLVRARLPAALAPGMTDESPWSAFTKAYLQFMAQSLDRETVCRFMRAEQVMRHRFRYRPDVHAQWPGCTLTLSSIDDNLSIDSTEIFRERYPHNQIGRFDAGGHWAPMLFPEHLNERILRFLNESLL